MTDEAIAEVYALAREAFAGGQRSFQFQSYPFRMTAENLAKHRADQHIEFWRNLKEGSDQFEVTREEPQVSVVGGRYGFNIGEDPEPAVAAKQARDDREVADLVAEGTPAVRLVYDDGGGHQSFREIALAAARAGTFTSLDDRTRRSVGDVSRPEALAAGPREVVIDEAASSKLKLTFPPAATAVASSKPTVPSNRAEAASASTAGSPKSPALGPNSAPVATSAAPRPAGEPASQPLYRGS